MDNALSPALLPLQATLERMRAEKGDLEAEYQRKRASLDANIAAYERVIANEAGTPLPPPVVAQASLSIEPAPISDLRGMRVAQVSSESGAINWSRKLRNITQPEALIQIAKERDGIVRVVEAKNIFLEAGLAKGKVKNVSGHIYHILSRSARFERIEPGVFRLLTASNVLETPVSEPHELGDAVVHVMEASYQ